MTTIETRVRDMESEFSNSEKIAAGYFLQNIEKIFRYPLSELARMSGTSQGAWVRFSKSLGFSGLKELKNALFIEMNQSAKEVYPQSKAPASDLESVFTPPPRSTFWPRMSAFPEFRGSAQH